MARIGDAVRVRAVARTNEERAVADYFEYENLPSRCLVEVRAEARVLVVDGKLVGLFDFDAHDAEKDGPIADFDYYGRYGFEVAREVFPEHDPAPGLEKNPVPRRPRRPRPRRDRSPRKD